MKAGFYLRLAATGMRQNRQLYIPYLLTCAGSVMMSYIFAFLSVSPVLMSAPGGGIITSVMGLGYLVMCVFSITFLYYTHSFLIRRRKKEFGLYNILGMGKRNLAHILIWETAITALIALAGGLVCGIALSKLAELGMVNLLHLSVDFSLRISFSSVLDILEFFCFIFVLLLLFDLWQIRMTSPVELLRSEASGEKPPKANFVLALLGLVVLGVAYSLALTITDPIQALLIFFFAVILVVLATNLLFVAGSVTLCRLLQKNKRFYYKTRHFVSVSSMTFRMKRNGESLATICILCTMVLVMLSSTFSLYIGAEDSLLQTYPYHINLRTTAYEGDTPPADSALDSMRAIIGQAVAGSGLPVTGSMDYRAAYFYGALQNGTLDTSTIYVNNVNSPTDVYVVPLEDYNRFSGRNVTLEPGEALLYSHNLRYQQDSFTVQNVQTVRIKELLTSFPINSNTAVIASGALFLVVPDWEGYLEPLLPLAGVYGDRLVSFAWFYGVDVDASDAQQVALRDTIAAALEQQAGVWQQASGYTKFLCDSRAAEREQYYQMYGSLLFLGVLLAAVFLCAVVLIMYYKQLSEGYEDQSRFAILQKVGMTKQEIRQSVNSQVLLVFFLPMAAAGVHLCFAFPMVRSILRAFSLTNTPLLVITTLVCFLTFAALYAAFYLLTSRTYYRIVSSMDTL